MRCIRGRVLPSARGKSSRRRGGQAVVSHGVVLRGSSNSRPSRARSRWTASEYANTYGPAQAFHVLTDGRHKFIWRPADGTEQFFDLEAHPRVERDLARVPAQRDAVAAWRTRMVRQLAGRAEGFSDGQKLIAGQPYPAIQKRPAK